MRSSGGFVVAGGGKPALDAFWWLHDRATPADDITWIRPRDSWLLNRRFFQPRECVLETFEGIVLEIDSPGGEAAGVWELAGQIAAADKPISAHANEMAFSAAYALGAPKWKVILSITMKAARAGVITGILLAVARIAGETAPLLFTALSNQFWTSNLGEPMASLPVTIFKFAMSPYENWQKLAWAGVFLITFAVLGLNILARVLTRHKN